MNWETADNPPKASQGKWSNPVIVVTNLGHVFQLSYFNGQDGGIWQRPGSFEKGEKVETWIYGPWEKVEHAA